MIALIDAHRAVYGVEPICQVLPIAPRWKCRRFRIARIDCTQ